MTGYEPVSQIFMDRNVAQVITSRLSEIGIVISGFGLWRHRDRYSSNTFGKDKVREY